MKVIFVGYNGAVSKSFIKKYKAKFVIDTVPGGLNLEKFEDAYTLFKNKGYDAAVYVFAETENAKNLKDPEADSKALVAFKNVQYSAIVNGVKKMLVLSDAADLGQDLVDASDKNLPDKVPLHGVTISRYLATLLAQKDKISTVLRVFDLYGNGVKATAESAMKVIDAALKGKEVRFGCDALISMVYLDDLLSIITEFLTNDFKKGIYNIAADNKVSFSQIVQKLRAAAKKRDRIFKASFDSKDVLFEHTANTEKLRSVLPDFKFTSLSSSINKIFSEKFKE